MGKFISWLISRDLQMRWSTSWVFSAAVYNNFSEAPVTHQEIEFDFRLMRLILARRKEERDPHIGSGVERRIVQKHLDDLKKTSPKTAPA